MTNESDGSEGHWQALMRSARGAMAPFLPPALRLGIPVVPVVPLSGVIGRVTPLRPGMTLAGLARTLDRAFAVRGATAVALAINSPGGSPVQSHLIYRRIRALAEEKKLPVIAFVEDVAASGGYMLACAADEIVCDPSSIVGSIGVVGGSFGFPEAMRRLGIERRVYASGERKVTLDPFLPENPDDVARLKSIQKDIHAHFIALVKASRGVRLKGSDEDLFSGEFWAAGRGIELGLADSIGDLRSVLRARFGDKVYTPVISAGGGLLSGLIGRRAPGAGPAGVADLLSGHSHLADDVISAVEARTIWNRYGL